VTGATCPHFEACVALARAAAFVEVVEYCEGLSALYGHAATQCKWLMHRDAALREAKVCIAIANVFRGAP
jgi:hypothetical protein